MSHADSKGNITLDRNEREVIGAILRYLAEAINGSVELQEAIIENIVEDLDLSKAFVYPNNLMYTKRKLTKEQFAALENGRKEYRKANAPQLLVDLAAEFRVRLEIDGTERNKKW